MDDIAANMLAAITGADNPAPIQITSDKLEEQKRYLIRNINSLSVEDRRHVGNLLVMNSRKDLLQPCNEGTVIDLDIAPARIIGQMYELVLHKINQRG